MSDGRVLFVAALVMYILSAGLYHVPVLLRGAFGNRTAPAAAFVGWLCHTAGILQRSAVFHEAPYMELRGAVATVAWVIVLLTLIVEWRRRSSALSVPAMSIAALTMILADTLPLFGHTRPLVPGLHQHPMSAHIGSLVAAYGSFALAFCAALLYLVQERRLKQKRLEVARIGSLPLVDIEQIANTLAAFGFSMLTLGLVLGGTWAASGQWTGRWFADPVVTATMATWLIYAVYLYRRGLRGSRGRENMHFLIAGFILIALTLLVLRPIFPGHHIG